MKKSTKNSQPIDQFINKSLYDKNFGYYMKKNPFGEKGDFVTSPNISVLFSEILTIWIILYWKKLGSPDKFNLIELGAGNGEMMFQIIKTSKNFGKFINSVNFFIYEKSGKLKKIQKQKLKNLNVKWIKNFTILKKNKCLFIGNEFLDAFPIKQFERKKKNWYEKHIHSFKNKRCILDVKTNIKYYENKAGFKFSKNNKFIEISFDLINFLKMLSKHLLVNKGGALFIDYGYNKQKMYDTLQGVKNHKKVDYLNNKGDVDISYLVNFNLITKIFNNNKMVVNGYTSQGLFLKELGILDRAELMGKNMSFLKKANLFYRVNRLIDNKHMGKLFKVIFISEENSKFKTGFSKNEIK